MAFPIIPVIMAAAQIIGSIAQNRANKKAAERQNAANLDLAKYTFEQNQAAVDKQNAYNTPQMQMDRYNQAGLNPNLIYGQGSSGNQSGAPNFDTPSAIVPSPKVPIPDMLNMYQDFTMRQAQIDNIKAQTMNTNERTLTERFNAILRETQGKSAAFDLDTKDMLRPYSLTMKENAVRQQRIQFDKSLQEILNLRKDGLLKDLVGKQKSFDISTQETRRSLLSGELEAQRLRNMYSEMGVGQNDNFFIRLMSRFLSASQYGGQIFKPHRP